MQKTGFLLPFKFEFCDGRAARWGGFFVDVGDSLRTIATS